MWQTIKDTLSLIGVLGTGIGALLFGWKQTQINKRMQELQDYVAISIIPKPELRLQIMNVGKINLYVHKWEIGLLTENFPKAILIPAAAPSFLLTSLSSLSIGQHPVKIYLTDESGKKYLSTGEAIIEPIAIHPLSQVLPHPETPPVDDGTQTVNIVQAQTMDIKIKMRAWSYKTEKYNWII